ncbi:hypothetical protein SODG_007508 [Sodalis praecaptivus]|nr:hypothetical protein NVIRENTERO_02405 [Sodalis praecaptivus]
MALTTKCPKCDSSSFELNSNTKVRNCQHKLHFIQCAMCGAAIGIVSDRHNGILEALAGKLGIR